MQRKESDVARRGHDPQLGEQPQACLLRDHQIASANVIENNPTREAPGELGTSQVVLKEVEFCRRVGISRVTAWRLRKRGVLPYLKVGSRIQYTEQQVRMFLKSCEHNSS
jgi:hypothetical protein